jgi:hypothetical protein
MKSMTEIWIDRGRTRAEEPLTDHNRCTDRHWLKAILTLVQLSLKTATDTLLLR